MFSVCPEVSILPPSPDSLPPLARISPLTRVTLPLLVTSDHNTAVPPLPLWVAETSIFAPRSIVTVVAWCRAPLPCQPPPTSTVPPPVAPEASSVLPLARVIWSPARVIAPPLTPDTSSVPLLVTLFPSITISPLRSTMLPARTVPLLFTTVASRASAALAVITTVPPSASMTPLLLTCA